jgi:hypothetical protein
VSSGTDRCGSSDVTVRLGPLPGLQTQERAVIVAIKNAGDKPCTVSGFATVKLIDAHGRSLPFHYVDGGRPYVTSTPPRTVVLQSGEAGYVLIAGSACTLAGDGLATSAQLRLPDWGGSVTTSIVRPGHGSTLAVCKNDPSPTANTVWLSPVEKDPRELVR